MRYQQDLQVQLRDRFRRLITSDFNHALSELSLVVNWIRQQPALRAIIAEAEEASPKIDLNDFKQSLRSGRAIWVSETEAERTTFGWKVMSDLVDGQAGADDLKSGYFRSYGSSNNFTDSWRNFVERVIRPFFDYVGEHIAAGNSALYVLERYVRSVEWFRRRDLHAKYESDHTNGEEVYNLDLQSFLFQDGNYVTHAKPRGASGEPDLVGDLSTDDPLICDGKIFGPGRTQAYLAKGFHQVIKYAQDHNKSTAYLVIFNLTDRLLQMPNDGKAGTWPPYVESSGVRVYFIVVRALPPAQTASKSGRAKPAVISRESLFDPDADEIDLAHEPE